MRKIPILATILIIGSVPAAFAAPPKAPTKVVVTEVAEQAFFDEVEALGTLRANESVELTAAVTELVTAVNFTDGQRVNKGDILVEMEASEELALLTEEQSNLNEADQQLKRIEALAGKGVASESTLNEQQRAYKSSKARIEAIQSRINQRRIAAPFDGVVGLRNISVGALVQPGTRITTIDDDNVMKLDFSVPAVFLPTLKAGIIIKAKARAFPGEVFEGTLASLDSRIDPVTRSIVARAIIQNEDKKLKPGLLMRVVLQKNPRQALIIPEEALIQNGSNSYVFVASQNGDALTAKKQNVTIGARKKGTAEIVAGLNIGDKIVTHGTIKMKPGTTISIMSTQLDNEPLAKMLPTTKDKKSL